MKNTRIFAVVMVVALIFGVYPKTNVSAAPISEDVIIQPFWINTDSIIVGLSFTDTTANCDAKVSGMTGTTKINATVTLERKVNGSYTAVKTWSNQSVSGDTLRFSDTYSVTKGYTYRLTITADVTRNGAIETVSNWVEKSL